MKKAVLALKLLEEFMLHSIGDILASDVEKAFDARLEALGFSGITTEAVFVQYDGVLLRFTSEEGKNAKVLFYIDVDDDENEVPMASTIPEEADDEFITIDLTSLDPPIDDRLQSPDMFDLEWVNKSTMNAILNSGNVKVIESDDVTYRQKGRNPLQTDSGHFKKLPEITRSSGIDDRQKLCMQLCRRLGWGPADNVKV